MNATDKDDRTPLHIATENGNEKIVKDLLNGGAKTNVADNYGRTPLHCAADKGRKKAAKELTAALLLLNKSNNANSKLSKETVRAK